MKPISILFALILLLNVAYAQSPVFTGNLLTGIEHDISGDMFKLTYDEKSDKVFVQAPAASLIVDNGDCKSNSRFRVCIDKVNFSYKNVTTYVYYYDVRATIYKLAGSLSTSTESTLTTLLQGEPAELKVTITNPSDFDITDIQYEQDLSQLLVNDVKGCELAGNHLRWSGSLKPKYEKTCTAAIAAESEGTFVLRENLSYFNGFEAEEAAKDSITIKVLPKQLKADYLIDGNVEVKQPFYLNISLRNINQDEKLEASAAIGLPGSIALLKEVQGAIKGSSTITFKFTLEPQAHKNYSFYLEASAESSGPIVEKYDYTIKNVRDLMENRTFANPVEPKLEVNFSAQPPELALGTKFIANADVKNPSRFHEMGGISAKLKAPYNEEITRHLDKLAPGEKYSIISNVLVLPESAQLNDYLQLELGIEYSFYGEKRQINESFRLNLTENPLDDKTLIGKEDTEIQNIKNDTGTETNLSVALQPADKSEEHVVFAEGGENALFSNKDIVISASIMLAVFVLALAVYLARRRKSSPAAEEQAALKDIEENILKK